MEFDKIKDHKYFYTKEYYAWAVNLEGEELIDEFRDILSKLIVCDMMVRKSEEEN